MPTLWIVIGNEHAAPAGSGIVLSTFTAVTVGAAAPAVPAVTAASASTATMKPRAFAFMLPSFGFAVERFDARRDDAAVAKPTRAMRSSDLALRVDPAGAAEIEVDHLRVVQEVRAAALEAIAPEVEHVAAVRHRERAACVLLDHEDRHAPLVDLADLVEDRVHEERRQPRRRLVEQEQVGLGDERARHRQHLPLAARQRSRTLPAPLAQARKQVEDLRQARLRVDAERRRAELEVLLDAQRREDVLALRDVADAARDDAVRLRAGDLVAAVQDRAR